MGPFNSFVFFFPKTAPPLETFSIKQYFLILPLEWLFLRKPSFFGPPFLENSHFGSYIFVIFVAFFSREYFFWVLPSSREEDFVREFFVLDLVSKNVTFCNGGGANFELTRLIFKKIT